VEVDADRSTQAYGVSRLVPARGHDARFAGWAPVLVLARWFGMDKPLAAA
jgi:hypothetical protein